MVCLMQYHDFVWCRKMSKIWLMSRAVRRQTWWYGGWVGGHWCVVGWYDTVSGWRMEWLGSVGCVWSSVQNMIGTKLYANWALTCSCHRDHSRSLMSLGGVRSELAGVSVALGTWLGKAVTYIHRYTDRMPDWYKRRRSMKNIGRTLSCLNIWGEFDWSLVREHRLRPDLNTVQQAGSIHWCISIQIPKVCGFSIFRVPRCQHNSSASYVPMAFYACRCVSCWCCTSPG